MPLAPNPAAHPPTQHLCHAPTPAAPTATPHPSTRRSAIHRWGPIHHASITSIRYQYLVSVLTSRMQPRCRYQRAARASSQQTYTSNSIMVCTAAPLSSPLCKSLSFYRPASFWPVYTGTKVINMVNQGNSGYMLGRWWMAVMLRQRVTMIVAGSRRVTGSCNNQCMFTTLESISAAVDLYWQCWCCTVQRLLGQIWGSLLLHAHHAVILASPPPQTPHPNRCHLPPNSRGRSI